MKKFIFIIILLIIIAGVLAYFGWINIPQGYFGIAHSKITGTIDYPLESGRFYWLWQKLVPKSFDLYTIKKEPYRFDIQLTHSLPGSDKLKEFGNFQLKMDILVNYMIDFNSAVLLSQGGYLKKESPDNFKDLFKVKVSSKTDEQLSNFILENMKQYSSQAEDLSYNLLDELIETIDSIIKGEAKKYGLKEVKVNISYGEIPQLAVYTEALKKYFNYMESVYALKEEELRSESEYQKKLKEDDVEIEKLKKYGELINLYPDMLKYFYIQKFGEKAEVFVLPQEEKSGFPKMLEKEKPPEQKLIPEEKVLPEEKAEEDIEIGKEKEETPAEKEKWYELLKFWRHFKKE